MTICPLTFGTNFAERNICLPKYQFFLSGGLLKFPIFPDQACHARPQHNLASQISFCRHVLLFTLKLDTKCPHLGPTPGYWRSNGFCSIHCSVLGKAFRGHGHTHTFSSVTCNVRVSILRGLVHIQASRDFGLLIVCVSALHCVLHQPFAGRLLLIAASFLNLGQRAPVT